MMTMKEACAYVAQKRKADAIQHRKTVTQGEYCSGLTAKEYRKVKCRNGFLKITVIILAPVSKSTASQDEYAAKVFMQSFPSSKHAV